LIDANDGTHRWSDTYDRKSGDAVDVQEEISANLVRALQLELDASSLADSHAMTRSGEAYDSYLRGRHALNRNDQHGFEEAIAYFRRALAIDPNFAAASEALAEAKVGMVDEDYVPADIGWEEARKAAQQALILNPHSARAHAILGYTHLVHDWDWGGAQRELEIAMSLTPNDAVVLTHAAQHRMAVGQLPEAALLIEAASAADPLDPYVFSVRLLVYHRQERLTDAVQAGRRALEISPTFSWQHYYLGVVFLDSGNAKAALTEMKQEVHPKAHLVGIADAYWALGQIQQANAALARAEREV
jgi:tetratricopeptide (TPR) repeat protein